MNQNFYVATNSFFHEVNLNLETETKRKKTPHVIQDQLMMYFWDFVCAPQPDLC